MPVPAALAVVVLVMILIMLLLFCWDCHGNECYDPPGFF